MKLSILFEARDPELEKTLEPFLQGPFGAYRFKKPRNFVPTMPGMQGKLAQAVRYHAREMNGERWPALEQAFVNRAITFSGKPGDYVRPRMTLFTYLSNIKEPWPEGEALAQKLIAGRPKLPPKPPSPRSLKSGPKSFHADDTFGHEPQRIGKPAEHEVFNVYSMDTKLYNRYMAMLSPGLLKYLINKNQNIPDLVTAIKSILQRDAEHKAEQAAGQDPHSIKSSYWDLTRRLGKQTVDLMQQYASMFTSEPGLPPQ